MDVSLSLSTYRDLLWETQRDRETRVCRREMGVTLSLSTCRDQLWERQREWETRVWWIEMGVTLSLSTYKDLLWETQRDRETRVWRIEMGVRLGRFCPFLEFPQKSWVCSSPRFNMGKYQICLILFKNQWELPTPLKVHNFKRIKGAKNKNIFFFCGKMCSLMPILYSKIIKSQ